MCTPLEMESMATTSIRFRCGTYVFDQIQVLELQFATVPLSTGLYSSGSSCNSEEATRNGCWELTRSSRDADRPAGWLACQKSTNLRGHSHMRMVAHVVW